MPIENLRDDYGLAFKLVLNNKFSRIEDLELWEERHKIKIPESQRSSIRKVIFADRDTPMKEIIPLLDYFKDKEEKNLFYALRKENFRDGVKICLESIELNHSNSDIDGHEKFSSWLTKLQVKNER